MVKSYLDFEQPIADIESKILELENSDLDPDQIKKEVIGLNESAVKLTEKIYSDLSPWQNVQVARHPERPHFVDYIERVTDQFDELHGASHFSDDRAIFVEALIIGAQFEECNSDSCLSLKSDVHTALKTLHVYDPDN